MSFKMRQKVSIWQNWTHFEGHRADFGGLGGILAPTAPKLGSNEGFIELYFEAQTFNFKLNESFIGPIYINIFGLTTQPGVLWGLLSRTLGRPLRDRPWTWDQMDLQEALEGPPGDPFLGRSWPKTTRSGAKDRPRYRPWAHAEALEGGSRRAQAKALKSFSLDPIQGRTTYVWF